MKIGSTLSPAAASVKRPVLVLIVVVALAAMTLAASPALLASSSPLNGSTSAPGAGTRPLSEREVQARIRTAAGPGQPSAADCRVLGPNGDPVTEVAAMSFGDLAYWLEYRSSGELARRVRFTTMPLFEGSPALGQSQDFDTDFSNVVTTPFGVPDWALNQTSGPWALVVKDNLGRRAVCRFEVVP